MKVFLRGRTGFAEEALVALEVAADGAHHDHGDDGGHDDDDHERVEDGEPVHAAARHAQVRVPARGPADVAQLPVHVVRVHQLRVCTQTQPHTASQTWLAERTTGVIG